MPSTIATRRIGISTCYLWVTESVCRSSTSGRPANRDVFSVTISSTIIYRERRLQAEAPVLVEDAAALREELGRDREGAPLQRRRCADALSERFVGGVRAAAGDR